MAERKSRLGRGLEVLLGEKKSLAENKNSPLRDELREISLAQIKTGKYQPRQEFNKEGLEELANSIRAQGVIQPIMVRTVGDNSFEIIAGERRWRAAELAGLTHISAIIRELPDEAALALGLIENIQRENLNPLEEALAIQRLGSEFGLTHQEIANSLGKSRSNISNLLRLLNLHPEVAHLLAQGHLDMGHARALLSLENEIQYKTAQSIVLKGLSVRQTEQLVHKMQQPPKSKEIKAKAKLNFYQNLQNDLQKKLKLAVKIMEDHQGGGKIILQYKNEQELKSFLAKIGK